MFFVAVRNCSENIKKCNDQCGRWHGIGAGDFLAERE
jgi:hypothetical protein